MNRTRITSLWCFAAVCLWHFSAFAATINLAVETDQDRYEVGDMVSWTIYAWASEGDNQGIALLSVHLNDDTGETLDSPLLQGDGFLDTAYSSDKKFDMMGRGTPAKESPRLRDITVMQMPWEKLVDVGNDGNSDHVLAKGKFVASSLGKHELHVIFNAANYWPDYISNAMPFEEVSELHATFVVTPPEILYVDSMATEGMNSGVNWNNSFLYLQDAMSLTANSSGVVTEIRVAQGTYTPDANSVFPDGTGDRMATFKLINGVTLKGGYVGISAEDSNERDVNAYNTILSGDLSGNDATVNDLLDLPIELTRAENSYHVVTSTNTDSSTVLDGFTVSGGNANDSLASNTQSRGGGIYCNEHSNLTISHCRFTGNSAFAYGGGMYNGRYSHPTLCDCTFLRNATPNHGAGIYTGTGTSPELTNCVFRQNMAGLSGGGITVFGSNPRIENSIFNENLAQLTGGGISVSNNGYPIIGNCTFSENTSDRGGGIYCKDDVSRPSTITIVNSILWGNIGSQSTDEYAQIHSNGGTPEINYSCIQGWKGDLGGKGNINVDPLFADPNNGDYHLKSRYGRWDPTANSWAYDEVTSPCIDAGNPSQQIGNESDDQSNVRINMGAYGGTNEASCTPLGWGLRADLTNDWIVNLIDMAVLSESWRSDPNLSFVDMSRDNAIDTGDLLIMAEDWLASRKWQTDLVGQWRFDDSAGNLAKDESINGNWAEFIGDPNWTSGAHGGAIELDGKDDYLAIEEAEGLDFAPDSFSVGVWIRLDSVDSDWHAVLEYDRAGPNWFGLWITGERKVSFRVGSNTIDTLERLSLNEWYFLTAVYDKSEKKMSLYINSRLDSTRNHELGFDASAVSRLTIGAYGYEGEPNSIDEYDQFFDGSIDDLHIYGRSLKPCEVQVLYEDQGLVGNWGFDEGQGSRVLDISENENHGTIYAGANDDANWPTGINGPSAVELDGNDDFVRVYNAKRLNLAPNSFSISTWINARQVSGEPDDWRTILEYDRAGKNWFGLWLSNEGKFHFRVGSDTQDSEAILKEYEWYQVVASYDSSSHEMRLYINGQLDSTEIHSRGFTAPVVADLTIGAYGYEGYRDFRDEFDQYFDGIIDDIKIFNRALLSEEVERLYLQKGMVGWWKFDECDGDTASDSSGYGSTGMLVAKPERKPGQFGGALDFDGTSDFVRIDECPALAFAPNSFSISTWINARKVSGEPDDWRTILEYDRAGTNWFGLWLSNEGRMHFRVGSNIQNSDQILDPDKWYLLTAVYDSDPNEMRLYINGQFDVQKQHNRGFTTPSVSRLTIGAYGYAGEPNSRDKYDQFFDGVIDDVRIYNRALSEAEINTLVHGWPSRLRELPSGTVTVDGDLSEWPLDTTWIDLDKTYYMDPADITDAKFALRWNASSNKIYAAVVVNDTDHVFEDKYLQWDASDRIEVYCQGDAEGGTGLKPYYDNAQQYMVGGPNTLDEAWAAWGHGYPIGSDAEFEYAVKKNGDQLIYEVGVTAFDNYGGRSGEDTILTNLETGCVVRFDLAVDTRWGSDGFGMLSENLMAGKSINAGQFARYLLVDEATVP